MTPSSGRNTGHLVPWIGAATSTPLSLSIKLVKESISNRGLRGLLLNFGLLFDLHPRIPANEGFPELVIEHLGPHLK